LKGRKMGEKSFDTIINQSDRRQGIQCTGCGARSGVMSLAHLEVWKDQHECGEPDVMPEAASVEPVVLPKSETPPPADDPETEDDKEEDEEEEEEEEDDEEGDEDGEDGD
jgi:hypothetical protein